jgi:ectoine hydroxylase-related dioxygenase (phytanoyl-CoA dioxygenase family)
MLTRVGGNLSHRASGPEESQRLEDLGYELLRSVLGEDEVAALEAELNTVYERVSPDQRGARSERANEVYRYEVLNRSALTQRVVAHPRILGAIEPLIGEDCHVIANTCWRDEGGNESPHGGPWHTDAGPHIPRPAGVPWDERIPYPVFAVGAHIYLWDCPLECGPTGVIPKSHKSGQAAPVDRPFDAELTCDGRGVVPLLAKRGDVALFVSDLWHRRLPTLDGDRGRFFLQCHYGRRDLAQRLKLTSDVHQLSDAAVERASTDRERALVGLHPPLYYDG